MVQDYYHINQQTVKNRYSLSVMTNPLGDEEEYDGQRDNLPLDDHYEVDYLRGNNYKWLFHSLNEWERAQERGQENQTTVLNDYDWLISIVTTDQDL